MIDIRLGDCLELMKTLPDNSVDLICTDPHYMMTSAACDQMKIDIPAISEQFRRIAKPHATWVVFGQTKSIVDWIVTNRKLFKYSLVWNKIISSGFLACNKRPLTIYELINIFGDGDIVYNPQKTPGKAYICKRGGGTRVYNKSDWNWETVNNGDRFPVDIISVSRGGEPETKHPFKKPVKLMEWLIKTYSNKGDVILDPFMGSGSTGVACVNLGRDFIGFELDPTYFELSQKRIGMALDDRASRLDIEIN